MFYEQQEKIIQCIQDNYGKYLAKYDIALPEITIDMLDFDKYKKDFTLFLEMSKLNFNRSSFDDDCGDIENLHLVCYLVCRNNTPEVLNKHVLHTSAAFYTLLAKHNTLDIAEKTTLNEINFYKYVEGTKNIVCSEFDLTLEIEV
jgi:hypothetical protein